MVDAESILTHTRTFVGAIVSGLSNWSARMTKDRHLCVATDREASASMARMKETALKVSDEIFARGDAEDAKAESHLARAEAPKREMANQVVRSATHERTGDHAARLESKAQEIRLM